MTSTAAQIRRLWLDATAATIQADMERAQELAKQAPDDPDVQGYLEGLAIREAMWKAE